MDYLHLAQSLQPLPAGIRVRVALDLLEQATRPGPPAAKPGERRGRVKVAEVTLEATGTARAPRSANVEHLATLLWEVLAACAADTDELPWSDPSEDLHPDVLNALASLSVRPASSTGDLVSRFSGASRSHAASRADVQQAMQRSAAGATATKTPVVERDPTHITLRAPALTVTALRNLSATDPALEPPAVPPPPPSPAPHKRAPWKAPGIGTGKAPATRPALAAPRAPSPVPAPPPAPVAAAAQEARSPSDASSAGPELLATRPCAAVVLPELLREATAEVQPQAPIQSAPTESAPVQSAPPGESETHAPTLDPWLTESTSAGTSAEVEPLAPKRRLLWPLVAACVAGAAVLIAVASRQPRGRELIDDLTSKQAPASQAENPDAPATPLPSAAQPSPTPDSTAAETGSLATSSAATTTAPAVSAPTSSSAKPPVKSRRPGPVAPTPTPPSDAPPPAEPAPPPAAEPAPAPAPEPDPATNPAIL